jgi:hypothetical protein
METNIYIITAASGSKITSGRTRMVMQEQLLSHVPVAPTGLLFCQIKFNLYYIKTIPSGCFFYMFMEKNIKYLGLEQLLKLYKQAQQ